MSISGGSFLGSSLRSASATPTVGKEISSSMETITAGIQTTQSSSGVGGIKSAVEAFSAEKMGSTQTIQSSKMTSIAPVAGYPSPTAQLKPSPAGAKYQKVLQHMENPHFQISKGLRSFAQMKLSSQIAGLPVPVPKPAEADAGKVGVLPPPPPQTEPGQLEYRNISFHLPEGRRMIDAEGFSQLGQLLLRTETSVLNQAQMYDALARASIHGGRGHDNIRGGSGNDN